MPRYLQIKLRRRIIAYKKSKYSEVWPIDARAAQEPDNWSGWPEGKRFALVLMHDVDSEKGQRKCYQLAEIDEGMGFKSGFNFVPERYDVSPELRECLIAKGFEIGVHGLKHDGKLFTTKQKFQRQAVRINHYLKEWQSVGFVSPSMHHNLEWMHDLDINYDASTFDTDPFEPQPDGVQTIFPLLVKRNPSQRGYVELPYTLPQDFTVFVLMEEKSINIWRKKLDWIAEQGGMALLITHPDYMSFERGRCRRDEYPVELYKEFLDYVKSKYEGQYWHVLPREMARFWSNFCAKSGFQDRDTGDSESKSSLTELAEFTERDLFKENREESDSP